MPEPLIIILVQGGVVQNVVSNQQGIIYRVINIYGKKGEPTEVYDEEATLVDDLEQYTTFAINPF